MKKLKKYSFEELSKAMQPLSNVEKSNIIGAGIIYQFDTDGRLVSYYSDGTDGPNTVMCNGQSLEIDKDLSFSSEQYEDSNGNLRTGDTITGGGMDLFYFLADNTNVEWGASYNTGSEAHIHTAHQEHSNYASFQEGYSNYIHSHPTVSPTQGEASSADISTGVAMLRLNYRGKETGTNPNYNYENFSIYKAHSSGSIDEDTIDYTHDVEMAYPGH